MSPIRLSDDELAAVLAAARPLPVHVRDAFLQEIAVRLAALPLIGPGAVARACRDAQRRFFDPPELPADDGWGPFSA